MKNQPQIIRPKRPRRAGGGGVTSARTDAPTPFRWDIAAKPELGSLLEGEAATAHKEFIPRLLVCGARTVALAGDSDLVFIGRSPESLFDLLTGLFSQTLWRERLTLLHFSTGYFGELDRLQEGSPAFAALRAYLDSLRLSPAKLLVRERPVALIDLICTGGSFHQFLLLLRHWGKAEGADWPAVRRKIRVIGIVRDCKVREIPRWKHRPKPYSWRDGNSWLNEGELLERGSLHEVPIDGDLWDFLGDDQPKTTRSYGPSAWGDPSYALPHRSEQTLTAVRFARRLFEKGGKTATRRTFAALLHDQPAIREEWLRRLAFQVRSG